ncbi:MAG: cysteinyl-tRNA synthetase [Anaerolineae bacterium]|nr:cysteinyl-tRNA synthetase [Anaerolineae bacterium]
MTEEINPGLIVLLGSGETAPTIRKVYHWLFEQMCKPVRLSILETPAGFEPNSDKVAQAIADFMEKRLQNFHPDIAIIPARKKGTPFSPDDTDIVSPLLDANVILMGPGSPTYAARQMMDSVAWHTLNARHRLGAHLIFASATTIASSFKALPVYEIYKVGQDLHWQNGLNFFDAFGLSLVFVPHWNNNDGGDELDTSHCYMGIDRYNQLIDLLPAESTIIGIDEQTALVIDPAEHCCHVMGNSDVRIIRNGEEKLFRNGQSFPTSELGPFHIPQPQSGIPTDVWDRVINAHQAAIEAAEQTPEPPAEVLELVEKREAVRARKEWDASDIMRDQIEQLGWKVLDTPNGAVVEPV